MVCHHYKGGVGIVLLFMPSLVGWGEGCVIIYAIISEMG